MRKRILGGILSLGLLFGATVPASAAVRYETHYSSRARVRHLRHKQHMRTLKRVGIGAAGGAAIGALAGGGKGAAIGGLAGAGAGALYDAHKRHHPH